MTLSAVFFETKRSSLLQNGLARSVVAAAQKSPALDAHWARYDLGEYLRLHPLSSILEIPLAVVDVTAMTPAVALVVGARLARADLITLCLHAGPSPAELHAMLESNLIPITSIKAGATTLVEELQRIRQLKDNDTEKPSAPPVSLDFTRRLDGDPVLWSLRTSKAHKIGFYPADITNIKNVDVWVNPENTFMEMARIHDRSISSIIRYLGAYWTKNNSNSDDYVFRALLDKVSRKHGIDRPVPAASVYLTKAGRLWQSHRVKRIAHVACVQPNDAARPGSGYKPVADLAACMKATLHAVAWNSALDPLSPRRTVLVPLFGTGTGGGDVRALSEILTRAATEYLEKEKPWVLTTVYFLAHTNKEQEACTAAFENLEQLERVAE
jgi:O-acetyl-ADP-ribose deacetylase (regulator of RNase III)